MPSIKKQVNDLFADRMAEASSHNLFHILRDENAQGEPMPKLKGKDLKARLVFQDLASAELRKRGHGFPEVSAMFLLCDHEEA